MILPLLLTTLLVWSPQDPSDSTPDKNLDQVRAAMKFAGLSMTDEELAQLLPWATDNLENFTALREIDLGAGIAPATVFMPKGRRRLNPEFAKPDALPKVERPENLEDLYWADIPTLSALLKSQQVTSMELTELFLKRLREVDKTLLCVTSYTEKRALKQARERDQELAQGRWRGPLHGIPYGLKDLCSVRGTKTTWGATPFKDQVIDSDAAVVRRLDAAGAVLIAKTTLGALAMGDIWYGGKTRSPWNTAVGSSGSSAGSAAAVAAGALPFAIGSETLGSIVSP